MGGHSIRAARALAHLPEHDPALALLALWCRHRDGDRTTRSQGETIWYGPEFDTLALREQIGLVGHHVLHVALRHGARLAGVIRRQGGTVHPDLFNLAADALVNTTLEAAGHALPRPSVLLSHLLGPDEDVALAHWDAERLCLHLARQNDGGRERLEHCARAQGFAPDLDPDAPDDSRAADWQGQLSRALAAGRMAGRGIGLLDGRLGDLPQRTTPWEVHLRGLLARAVMERPRLSHARPARRWLALDALARAQEGPAPAFQPGAVRDARRPRIAVGIDTSGSVSDDTLSVLGAELAGIARRTGAETHLLAFDETVHHQERVDPGRWQTALGAIPLRRGGGTAFADVLARADALDVAIAVILTDLDGAFGPAPRCPVLWAVPVGSAGAAPPFGRVLSLAD